MISLKDYQLRVLDSLRNFLRRCSQTGSPEPAFREVTAENFGQGVPYQHVEVAGLSNLPYVCLRVPTGGGKTLLACHACGIATKELLHGERAVVLWLVPSNTILDQTADALRNPRHPYRRALELECGAVEVVTIQEALRLSRATVEGQTVVIVSTIQCFRVDDETGRKVYEQNGSFSDHFLRVPAERLGDLEMGADGQPKPSLVNMLRLRRPVVIVDEAHNARTDLSFVTLGKVLPSCIVEFTATPATTANRSNVLHRTSAAELKAAQMVKLPLRVVTRHPGQRDQLLAEAIALRGDLEKLALAEAQSTGEFVRPILLIQAERVDGCETLRGRLVSEFAVPIEQIKISVGSLDELKDVKDIAASGCPVRFIITVQKLREGWDCPFAYALCSLKETRSATAIEQIVGRILRLPNATLKQHPDLNCAYAFSVSDSIVEVLTELREALESNGFTRAEAERIILPVSQPILALGAQPKTVTLDAVKELDVPLAQKQAEALAGKVKVDAAKGEITVLVPLSAGEEEKLVACVKTEDARERVARTVEAVRAAERAFGGGQPRVATPYEQQLEFIVPLLCVQEGEEVFEFDTTHLLERAWRLSEKNAELSPEYDPRKRPAGRAGLVDVGLKGEVTQLVLREEEADGDFVARLHQQVLQLGGTEEWSVESLIQWLDRNIEHADIPAAESAVFLRRVVVGVMAKHGIQDVGTVALDRFRLRDEIEQKIDGHRRTERQAAFQALLLPESALLVGETRVIDFRAMGYEPSWLYEGGFVFNKHYFGAKPGEMRDGTEEFECAQFLDGLAEVKFWVRNLSRKPSSFRLQTSRDWFYPDFVCQLTDGRVLVVEYKGGNADKGWYAMPDSEEKRAVGAVWEERSGGRCLFIMPPGKDFAAIRRKICG
jgi:type III restriction enzyme